MSETAKGCICETVPAPEPQEGTLYLWSDFPHTHGKLRRLMGEVGVEPRLVDNALTAPLGTAELRALLPLLRAELSGEEQLAIRALLKPGAEPPGFNDFASVMSLQRFLGRHENQWVAQVLSEGRLETHFQPIVLAHDPGTVYAHEALLRASDAEGQRIPPARLFAAARAADLTAALDLAARRSAIFGAATAGVESALFVNFTPSAIYDPRFCLRSTAAAARAAGIDPHRIVFEVVESDDYGDVAHLRGILAEYRRNGFRVALDDLGAGYASLSRLSELRPDIVKLDMALVRGIDGDSYKGALAAKLVDLARSLGIAIVAEGVETAGELRTLQTLGVDYVQGYHIARPAALPMAGRPAAARAV
ncbi:MAG TPA: EAL domain-containing protein [Alphaproteobacteria bacterium]|nr:EAL domain-containing protein [Alphaproteobacteria bacterium]